MPVMSVDRREDGNAYRVEITNGYHVWTYGIVNGKAKRIAGPITADSFEPIEPPARLRQQAYAILRYRRANACRTHSRKRRAPRVVKQVELF